MKLHPITWVLLGVAGVQLAALSVDLAGLAKAADDAGRMRSGWSSDTGVLQALVGQFLGQSLHRLGGIVVSASLAVWVEILSRIHHRLRVQNARG